MSQTNRILLLTTFLSFITMGLFGPIYAIYVNRIGGDILQTSFSYGVFSIVSGIFIFSLGRSKVFKRNLRLAVFIGFAIYTIGEAGYLIVANPIQLFIVQIILGIAAGILEPSWDGLFFANMDEHAAAEMGSNWGGVRDLAVGIGAFLGGAIVAFYSFKILFIVMIALHAAATLVSARLLYKQK